MNKMIKFETEKARKDLMNYLQREGTFRIEGLTWRVKEGEIDVDIEVTYQDDFIVTAYDQETEEVVIIDFNQYPFEWSELDAELYEIV